MDEKSRTHKYNDEETANRRDDALRRALSMPPAPLKTKPKKKEGKQKRD